MLYLINYVGLKVASIAKKIVQPAYAFFCNVATFIFCINHKKECILLFQLYKIILFVLMATFLKQMQQGGEIIFFFFLFHK